ncbi:MAG: response regulator [Helicobacteraceae bacterium]|nr:response regulator [Helicobacteraceae bacterium]
MFNILVVDDAKMIRRMLTMELEKMGHYVVAEAETGREAIHLYEKHSPDIVTMDITMPGLNGVETLKEIKKIDKTATIIMITSHGEEKLVMEAIVAGAKGYILKPLSKNKLIDAILRACPEAYGL